MLKHRGSKGDLLFDISNYTILAIIMVLVIYPVYFVFIASFSDPDYVNAGKVLFIPKGISFKGYDIIFKDMRIWMGYKNSILYTVIGTFINLAVTLPCAYALSRKDMRGRLFFTILFLFTMYFKGGIVPSYILIRNLNMFDSIWSLVLPGAVNVYYLIIARTFFETTIPGELLESTRIDGANNTIFFFRMVLPLSKALIAVLALYYALIHWNSWFSAFIYFTDDKKFPLQLILKSILISVDYSNDSFFNAENLQAQQQLKETVKYAVILVACIPVLILYPFIQKYFIKGVMIGSVKG